MKKIVILLTLNALPAAIKMMGPKNVTELALGNDTTDGVLLIGLIDGTNIDKLRDDLHLKVDEVGASFTINNNTWAQVGRIVRRNGAYAVTGATKLEATKGFAGFMKMVLYKEIAALDTTFGHTANDQATWAGVMGGTYHKMTFNGFDVTAVRFGFLGPLVLADDKKTLTQTPWLDYYGAFADDKTNDIDIAPKAETIYTFDGQVQSLAHVNGTSLVANLATGKKVMIELDDLYGGKRNTAKFVGEDTSLPTTIFVGTVAYDEDAPFATIDTARTTDKNVEVIPKGTFDATSPLRRYGRSEAGVQGQW